MWSLFSKRVESTVVSPQVEPAVTEAAARPIEHSIADVEMVNGVAVATITVNELSATTGLEGLADLLAVMQGTGASHCVLDLQNVNHMDSGCVGTLVEAINRLGKSGARLALVNPDRSVAYLFKLTRLDRVFPICRDVMSAIATLKRDEPR